MVEIAARPRTLPVVTCAGSPRARGEAHGEALREQIACGLARWAESIAASHQVEPDQYVTEFISGTEYLPAIRRWTPSLLVEMHGIAQGANQPWNWIYAYNLLDEEWTWARTQRKDGAPGCTAVGLAADGASPLLGQTMDIPSVHDGTQAVLRLEVDKGPDALVFTHAGMIGLTGCNADGLALVVNNLDVLPTSATGLPVAFVIRGVLERRNLAQAVAFVREVSHSTGQHYGMASPEGLASVEGWANGTSVAVAPGASMLHTNHPLHTADTEGDVEIPFRRSRTRERLAFIQEAARSDHGPAGLRGVLSDRTVPISLGADRPVMTFGTVVYECTAPPRMWAAPGPPHETPFVEISW